MSQLTAQIVDEESLSPMQLLQKQQQLQHLSLPQRDAEVERVGTANSWKQRIEEKQRIENQSKSQLEDAPPVESYRRLYTNIIQKRDATENADKEIENKFDELIRTDQFEAKKSKNDILDEIFTHTDRRVIENQKKLVEL